MGLKPQVELPPDLVDRSWKWAKQVVEDYAAGRNAASRAVTCFDAHSNVELQAHAKMAECAFAIWADANPIYAITWNRYCDGGSDFVWRGKRWDVKATRSNGRYLIWPIGKNHIFTDKHFDMLVLVKHDVPHFEITGFVSKEEFYQRKKIAEYGHALVPGTWHMHQADLWSPELLMEEAV